MAVSNAKTIQDAVVRILMRKNQTTIPRSNRAANGASMRISGRSALRDGRLSHSAHSGTEQRELLATLEKERETVATEQEKLYRLFVDGGSPSPPSRSETTPWRPGRSRSPPRSRDSKAKWTSSRFATSQAPRILAEAQTLYDQWETLPFETRRQIVEAIVDRITSREGRSRDPPHTGYDFRIPQPPDAPSP